MAIVRRTRADLDLSKVDWSKASRAGDRQIARQVAADADTAPLFTDAELRRARRAVPPVKPPAVKALR
ncbi:MAG: hypothetical protein ACRD9W_27135, partial [Terriglobia bacterium]